MADILTDPVAAFPVGHKVTAGEWGQLLQHGNPDPRRWGFADDCFFLPDTATTGMLLDGGVASAVSGAGAAVAMGAVAAANPGILDLATGTTTTGRAGLLSTQVAMLVVGGGVLRYRAVIKIPTLSTSGERFTVRGGFGDSISAAPTDGVHFDYVDNVASGAYRIVAEAGGTPTAVNGTTAVGTTFDLIEIIVAAGGGSAQLYLNNVLEATVSSGMPSSSQSFGLMPLSVIKSVGTTTRSVQIDMYDYSQEMTTARTA